MRVFESGALRDSVDGKLAYNRFLSPEVLTVYCHYLDHHRNTANGVRDPDNWKAGIPTDVYMESIGRHYHELWTQYEQSEMHPDLDVLSAILFNTMGMMYEIIQGRYRKNV